MAVYTDVSDEAISNFLTLYDVGELASFKGIAEGVENSNYLLATDEAPFILTLYEKRVNEADLPFFLGLMEHLAGNDISCPLPIAQRGGKVLGTLEGRPAAMISFLEGYSVRRPQKDHCFAVGEALAQFHQAGEGFELSRENGLGLSDWRPLYDKSAAQADSVISGLKEGMEASLDKLEANWPSDLPRGIVHADLFSDNVFFLKGELSGIIDFYFACNDMLAYDIAICLNAWCFESDNSFNVTKAKALLRGYESIRPLTAAEKEAMPILAEGAAMRFLVTRLYDWLSVPEDALVVPKNPREYWEKLNFHHTRRSYSEYGGTA